MSTDLAAVIQLAANVKHPRRRGWHCTCEFEEIVSRGGERFVGVEVTPANREEVSPGEQSEITLRLWAPIPIRGESLRQGDRREYHGVAPDIASFRIGSITSNRHGILAGCPL